MKRSTIALARPDLVRRCRHRGVGRDPARSLTRGSPRSCLDPERQRADHTDARVPVQGRPPIPGAVVADWRYIMTRPLVPDELWEVVQPLLPRHRARPGKRGRPPGGRPGLPDRHHLRPAKRHPLGDAAPGDGLRLRHDLLAATAVLAAARRLEEAPPRSAPAGRPGGGHRLGALLRGQPDLPRCFWGS